MSEPEPYSAGPTTLAQGTRKGGERPEAVIAPTVSSTSELDLTPAAHRLAVRYTRVLDLSARCTRALEEGDWVLLNNLAGELSVAADELSESSAAVTRDETATDPLKLIAYVESLTELGDES